MQAIADRLDGLAGWRRWLAAFVFGVLSVLAMAPWHVWPILFLTLSGLTWLLDGAIFQNSDESATATWRQVRDGKRVRAAAAVGWFFGFGYFLAGLYWIGEAFLVEAEKFAWLLPFAVSMLPAGLALFYGLATAAAALFWRAGAERIIALAIAFACCEWLRGHVLTGFPWNSLGYSLTGNDALMQLAAIFGVYALAFWAVLLFAAPAALAVAGGIGGACPLSHRLALPLVMVVLLGGAMIWGTSRLEAKTEWVDDVKLRLVQPNVPQREKWKPENQRWIFARLLEQSRLDGAGRVDDLGDVTHVIWPESSLPFLLLRTNAALEAIAKLLPEPAVLAVGGIRMIDPPSNNSSRRRVFNSLMAIDHNGSLISVYDKIHLVPFGEYLIFQDLMEWVGLEQLTRMAGGFDSGDGPRRLSLPGAPPASPLICYEAIFSDDVTPRRGNTSWMLNVTNDAWFGSTSGPLQHFHQARVRSVEEGLPLIRVANNGISAVIDSYGRVLSKLDLNIKGSIDSRLPLSIAPTVFKRFADSIFIICLCLGVASYVMLCTSYSRTRPLPRA